MWAGLVGPAKGLKGARGLILSRVRGNFCLTPLSSEVSFFLPLNLNCDIGSSSFVSRPAQGLEPSSLAPLGLRPAGCWS